MKLRSIFLISAFLFLLVHDICIAEKNGEPRMVCTDVQCNNDTDRFRGRLKLDQTGSLTVTNIIITDSGLYTLQIISGRISITRSFSVTVTGAFSVGTDGLSAFVMEGDSVALHTNVETKQQEDIKWYFNDTRIAQISGDLSFICTDVQCNGGNERFRDRLELDNKTGSLTIRDIRTTDSGLYELKIISSRYSSENTFNVSVHGVSAAERDEMKRKSVMEGESVTLDPGLMKNPNDSMLWYFKDICIAEKNGEPRMVCTDVQCNNDTDRFRGRLKLDQTGSLTVTNIIITDSGLYTLQIISGRISITRSFSVTVTVSGLSAGTIAGICIGVLLLMAAAVFVCRMKKKDTKMQYSSQVNGANLSPDQSDSSLMDDTKERSSNHTDAVVKNTTNGLSSNQVEIYSEAASEV